MGRRAVAAGAGCAMVGASKLTLKFGMLCSDTWRLYMLGRVTAVLCGPEVKEQKAPPWLLPSTPVLFQLTGIPSALAPPGPGALPQGFAMG